MSRHKIDYGIDLGTTNSAIARIENGEPVIKKTDTLKDTLPSSIGFNKKKSMLAGDSAWNTLKSDKINAIRKWDDKGYNTFIEFKRTMGTDKKFYSSHMDKHYDSEALSAEVLKKLKSFVLDEEVSSIVVTVPAKFDVSQMDATLRAAKLAGFRHCELLQEPIAASMAYGLDAKNKNGFWIVFDFGGGTFDAALIKVEEGIMKVVDTDGDNFLGGKNLDMAIVDEIILPYFKENYAMDSILEDEKKKQILQEAMKYYAEEAKIQLSFKEEHNILSDLGDIPGEDDNGEEFELDITISREDLEKVIGPIYQRAINITKDLLKRNNLNGTKVDSLILVGGPTHSPILRAMLSEQITKPDTSVDPMTAVATGAALYASTVDVSDDVKDSTRDNTRIQLDVGYTSTTVELEEWISLKILPEKTQGVIPDTVFAELVRGDKSWSSGKIEIYNKGEVIEAKLNEGKSNRFDIVLYDEKGSRLACQPESFNIIQGIGGAESAAVLTHTIGIEVDKGKPFAVFEPVKGLEKNVSIPAKGIANGLKTQRDIRPGIAEDTIEIALYQGEIDSLGSRASYNKLIYKVEISGNDLPRLLPENSDVDLTITTDKSAGRIEKLEAYFPYLDFSVEIPIPEKTPATIDQMFLENELSKAGKAITRLSTTKAINKNKLAEIEKELTYQKNRFEQSKSDSERRNDVQSSLKKLFRDIDRLEEKLEWPQLEDELNNEMERLDKANDLIGNENTNKLVEQVRSDYNQVVAQKDIQQGKNLLEEIHNLFFAITFIYQLINFISHHSENFEGYPWRDKHRARQLINEAQKIITINPTREELHPIVLDLLKLLPREYVENTEVGAGILRKE